MRHLFDFDALTMEEWKNLYKLFSDISERPGDYCDALRGKTMASLFYEPSTRTSFSFQSAMLRLGGGFFGFSDPNSSSVAKGESLKDTIVMCTGYADAVVMRHPREGAAMAASLYASSPIINAGDGGHLHPTQTLTDLSTLTMLRGEVANINVGLCGDLKNGRTVHSLIRALARFPGVCFYLISPRDLSIPSYLRDFMHEAGLRYYESSGLEAAIGQLDVLYMTRIQRERFTDPHEYERHKGVYVLNMSKLKNAKSDLVILHPLPRVDEIDPEVDDDPRAKYFLQAKCGMYIRMALLLEITKQGTLVPDTVPINRSGRVCKNPNCITAYEFYLPPAVKNDKYCAYCDKEI